jgi:hypothetical protein
MMKKFAIPLSLVAAAALTACATTETVTVTTTDQPVMVSGPAAYVYPNGYGYIAVTERPYVTTYYTTYYPVRSGFGRVETFVPVYYTTGAATGYSRIRLMMQDGSVQIFDTNGPSVEIGAWVEVTPQLAVTYPVAAR